MTETITNFGNVDVQDATLLSVCGIDVSYTRTGGGGATPPKAVDGASFNVSAGETLGLIGESGSGKSTICKVLAGLITPDAGSAVLDGQPLVGGRSAGSKTRRQLQMVFQDPHASLDTGLRVRDLIREPLRFGNSDRSRQYARVSELVELVGLDQTYLTRFPHQMSGGQLQRVALARGLAPDPKVLIADEILSALDVSVQAQVANLLVELQRTLGVSYLLVAHDLAALRRLSDHIAVMYRGRIVERGPADEVYAHPKHPYTVSLMAAAPQPTPGKKTLVQLAPRNPTEGTSTQGCPYRTRCWLYARLGYPDRCVTENPERDRTSSSFAACHYSHKLANQSEYHNIQDKVRI